MSLANAYVQANSRIPSLLQRIRDGQAPDQFTLQLLRDLGFTSSSDRAFIALLKAIDFLTPDGKPTSRYHDYRDHSRSRRILGDALLEAYKDIFLIKRHPTETDFDSVQGKFKSFHNCSVNVAKLMASTFFFALEGSRHFRRLGSEDKWRRSRRCVRSGRAHHGDCKFRSESNKSSLQHPNSPASNKGH
jgi:Family of unknown function (DUF5343)